MSLCSGGPWVVPRRSLGSVLPWPRYRHNSALRAWVWEGVPEPSFSGSAQPEEPVPISPKPLLICGTQVCLLRKNSPPAEGCPLSPQGRCWGTAHTLSFNLLFVFLTVGSVLPPSLFRFLRWSCLLTSRQCCLHFWPHCSSPPGEASSILSRSTQTAPAQPRGAPCPGQPIQPIRASLRPQSWDHLSLTAAWCLC